MVTAKNILESQHFINTKGIITIAQIKHDNWPTRSSCSFEYFQDDVPFDDDFLEPSVPKDQGKSTLLAVEVYSFLNDHNLLTNASELIVFHIHLLCLIDPQELWWENHVQVATRL